MSQIHACQDSEDAVALCPHYGLFLKPIFRMNISVHFPTLKQTLPSIGKSVSSWDIMERIKALVLPDIFISIKVVKNTLEFIRFEGDLENKASLKNVMGRLEGRRLKVTSIKEPLKVLVAEAKIPFPTKYDWDSFFRDAKQMNEMKSGERPDTVHFQNLPTDWFCNKGSKVPSVNLFRRVWSVFGEIRCLDIPMLDAYRHKMKPSIAGVKTFTFNHDLVFEAYVQFKEYLSFVKLMDALRKSFLLLKKDGKCWVAAIKVDFDKSKHLSEDSIRKREIETERLRSLEKSKEPTATESQSQLENANQNLSNLKTAVEPEAERDNFDKAEIENKIAEEERKYLIARRKLEAIRVMDFLFERVKKALPEDNTISQLEEASQSQGLHPSRSKMKTAEDEARPLLGESPNKRRRSSNERPTRKGSFTYKPSSYEVGTTLDQAYEKYFKSITR